MKRRDALKTLGAMADPWRASLAAAPAKSYKIALVMKALSNPFFHTMQVGAEGEAKKLGVTLLVQGTNKETDVTQQINIVQNFINQQVDAIVIAPASSSGLIPVLFQAQQQGIYGQHRQLTSRSKANRAECPFARITPWARPGRA